MKKIIVCFENGVYFNSEEEAREYYLNEVDKEEAFDEYLADQYSMSEVFSMTEQDRKDNYKYFLELDFNSWLHDSCTEVSYWKGKE